MLIISIIVVVVLAGIALMPAKKPEQSIGPAVGGERVVYRDAPEPARVSIRQQMLDEEAEALSLSYRNAAHDRWMAEVAAKGVDLLSVSKADA